MILCFNQSIDYRDCHIVTKSIDYRDCHIVTKTIVTKGKVTLVLMFQSKSKLNRYNKHIHKTLLFKSSAINSMDI